jgi:hypothetical protein
MQHGNSCIEILDVKKKKRKEKRNSVWKIKVSARSSHSESSIRQYSGFFNGFIIYGN